MSQKINPSIFREYDIRGIAGKDLTPEFAEQLGFAYAQYLGRTSRPAAGRAQFRATLGWDCRLSSPPYADAVARGMLRGGLDVIRLGMCPTPLSYFSLFHLDCDGGIMITGSHNPADYNGFKICIGRETIYGGKIQDLRATMEHPAPAPVSGGALSEFPIIEPYIEHLLKIARPVRKMKIVLDSGNGTGGLVAPQLFQRLGAEVIPLYCDIDGRFPNHHPDPTVPENLKDLVARVLSEHAAFGVSFDGDSDRIGLVDETGRIRYGDEQMIMYSRDLLKEHPGATVISEVKSSYRLYNDIAAHGGSPLMWKTGHSLIKSKMKETGALLAGEMSGHMFFADRYFGYDDAIYSALRVYEIASKSDHPLSEQFLGLPDTVSTPEIRMDCDEDKKFRLVEETKLRLSSDKSISINDIDGVRADFGDGWGLVRASNTQPVLVLRFEAPTKLRLDEIRRRVETALLSAARAVGQGPLVASNGH